MERVQEDANAMEDGVTTRFYYVRVELLADASFFSAVTRITQGPRLRGAVEAVGQLGKQCPRRHAGLGAPVDLGTRPRKPLWRARRITVISSLRERPLSIE